MYKQIKDFQEFKFMFSPLLGYSFSKEGLLSLYDYCLNYEKKVGVQFHVDSESFNDEYREVEIEQILKELQFSNLTELESETIVIKIPNTTRIIYYKFED